MENQNLANEPKKKMNDFVVLALGLVVFIAALFLLKYAMAAFHLI